MAELSSLVSRMGFIQSFITSNWLCITLRILRGTLCITETRCTGLSMSTGIIPVV